MINPKYDSKVTKMAARAAPLDVHLTNIRDAKTLEEKKEAAIAMANDFEVGGRDNFIKAIEGATKPMDIDRIAYNAALKGEGLGTKRFS
jgi:hypothetical protein